MAKKHLYVNREDAIEEYAELEQEVIRRLGKETDGHLLYRVLVPEEEYPLLARGYYEVVGPPADAWGPSPGKHGGHGKHSFEQWFKDYASEGFYVSGIPVVKSPVHAREAHYLMTVTEDI